jgi:hypothetical protein
LRALCNTEKARNVALRRSFRCDLSKENQNRVDYHCDDPDMYACSAYRHFVHCQTDGPGKLYEEENSMASKVLSALLTIALTFVLCIPLEAQNAGKIVSNGTIAGVIVGVVAGVAVLAIVAIHYSKKRTITGCVNSEANGMTVTDEKDKQSYLLSGDTTNVKPGDRMRLQGNKVKPKGSDKTLAWDTRKVANDFGVCQP